MIVLIILALSCPEPLRQNVSGDPWNAYDKQEEQYCQKRCGELYDDSPCLKLFRKFEKQGYTCICGAKKK